MAVIHLGGRLVDAATARIDPADRGFLLADGLFETLRVYDGEAFKVEAHLARLAAGAHTLGIPMPAVAEITLAIADTLSANKLRDASLRITLTRGPGQRGLLPPKDAKATLLIAPSPAAERSLAPMTAHIASIRRNEHSPLSRVKSLAYLDNILALREAAEAGFDEALLLNTAGRLAGGSRSNLFLVLDGILITPPLSEGVLAGITRQAVLDLAADAGIETREMPLTMADLARAGEALICNSLLEVRALSRIDKRVLLPGPTANALAERYRALTG
ncbi:MAG TPA: aminotransferase class IV [Candidatus Polarisedimenticolia bacterium]|nr:aminotransferase class IV [Candidatus Polarisedimenticolia bacterium]